jgi:hypothetical protein
VSSKTLTHQAQQQSSLAAGHLVDVDASLPTASLTVAR